MRVTVLSETGNHMVVLALQEASHEVSSVTWRGSDQVKSVGELISTFPRVVVNLCDDASVPAVLKDLDIPYTGSDSKVYFLLESGGWKNIVKKELPALLEQAESFLKSDNATQVLLIGDPPLFKQVLVDGGTNEAKDNALVRAKRLFAEFGMSGYGKFIFRDGMLESVSAGFDPEDTLGSLSGIISKVSLKDVVDSLLAAALEKGRI